MGFTLAFALQLRKKHGKTSVRVVIHKHTCWISDGESISILLTARYLGSSIILSDGYLEALCLVVSRPECKAKAEIKNACSDTSEEDQTSEVYGT